MAYSMPMRDMMKYEKSNKKKTKKIKVNDKEYDLSEFDDRHYWSRNKKK